MGACGKAGFGGKINLLLDMCRHYLEAAAGPLDACLEVVIMGVDAPVWVRVWRRGEG